jgi:hypothetical protein
MSAYLPQWAAHISKSDSKITITFHTLTLIFLQMYAGLIKESKRVSGFLNEATSVRTSYGFPHA